MFTTLPPLHSLLAFEAAGRLGSFQQAANALHLTPSAVSHRIRQLETTLGHCLFERQHRRIRLTAVGRLYHAQVHTFLNQLNEATQQLGQKTKSLRLLVAPALGSKWLMHALTRYQNAHPGIEFQLLTRTSPELLGLGEADLGLVYGVAEQTGCTSWKLFDETLIAVCSPDYQSPLFLPQQALKPQTLPSLSGNQLLRHPLLSWQSWFAQTGLPPVEATGTRYEDALLMLEAAAAGQGLALMGHTLAAPYLANGTLVRALPQACAGAAFYALVPQHAMDKPWVPEFVRWLVRYARTSHASPPPLTPPGSPE